MSVSEDVKFHGWVGKDKNSIGNLVWEEYTPKPFTDDDVQIKITHCGICASDLHTLRSGWGPTEYPQVVGHEIVGVVERVGKNVTHLKVGDRAGVGAQSDSCKKCGNCKIGDEPYCENGMVGTYGGRFKDEKKSKSFGGYAERSRVPGHFAFKIPDNVPSAIVAPMMCGGVTVYSPLKYHNAGPGKKVGVVGIGGLGHFAILFAKALNCDEVVAVSRSKSKEEDAKKMGASRLIATEDESVFKANAGTLDLIVCTVNADEMPLASYLGLLKANGTFVVVGLPEGPLKDFKLGPLIWKRISLAGSLIGGTKDITEMLELVSKQNIKSWIEERPMSDANQAVLDMQDNKARYRYVLVNPQ